MTNPSCCNFYFTTGGIFLPCPLSRVQSKQSAGLFFYVPVNSYLSGDS
nr:MAG TPA: hypothetical protein [Bacteriophage sp.]